MRAQRIIKAMTKTLSLRIGIQHLDSLFRFVEFRGQQLEGRKHPTADCFQRGHLVNPYSLKQNGVNKGSVQKCPNYLHGCTILWSPHSELREITYRFTQLSGPYFLMISLRYLHMHSQCCFSSLPLNTALWRV